MLVSARAKRNATHWKAEVSRRQGSPIAAYYSMMNENEVICRIESLVPSGSRKEPGVCSNQLEGTEATPRTSATVPLQFNPNALVYFHPLYCYMKLQLPQLTMQALPMQA